MPVDLNDTNQGQGIDAFGAPFQTMLDGLQGNILKGHGRDHTVHFFVRFRPVNEVNDLRAKVREVAQTYVTSALRQRDETRDFKDWGIPGPMFGNFFLAKGGYAALGIAATPLGDGFFTDGLKARAVPDFNDPDVTAWETGWQNEIHALLLLADDDPAFLLRQARAALSLLQTFCEIVVVEHGHALRAANGDGIEHFGYVDGRSQPIYFAQDLGEEGPHAIWNPVEPLGQVLLPDPLVGEVGGDPTNAFGSYFVFRKLEQDVLGFKTHEQRLANALNLLGDERERAGALVVGRFEDGTPVTLSSTDGFSPSKANDFDYAGDAAGQKCPFQGHIRKTNPRGDTTRQFGVPIEQERAHRITRRGITYGLRAAHPQEGQDLSELPSGDVGLLFMCFGSSIADQFAFMQSAWANNQGFVNPGTGTDPVIGQLPSGNSPNSQQWSSVWDTPSNVTFSFTDFVHLKGGEFFFAPSLHFLLNL